MDIIFLMKNGESMKKYCYGLYAYFDKKKQKFIYIGADSHIDEKKRHKAHLAPCNYNIQKINQILQKDKDNRYQFKILYYNLPNKDIMYNLEKKQVALLKPKFNFTEGGEGIPGFKQSEKTKKKMSEAKKGKPRSEETKKKISEALKGKNHPNWGKPLSEETKKKMSEAKKGEKNPKYWEGKTRSEETKRKMSKARNTSGYYGVYKDKSKDCKQGFRWKYQYHENGKNKHITSVDINKLKEKVLAKGLKWEEY